MDNDTQVKKAPPVIIETKVMDDGRRRPRAGAFVRKLDASGQEIEESKRIAG
ncbi:hypothetical protein KKC52_12600 [bacterium]|nr:hypothetical protein [bacterium]